MAFFSKKKKTKVVGVAFLLLLFGLFSFFYYDQKNEGFSIRAIRSHISYHADYDVAKPSDGEALIPLFNQKFYYMRKGCQSYVFVSEDGQLILKFFKQKHLRPKYQTLASRVPSFISSKIYDSLQRREERVEALFSSSALAYTHLSEETGVRYIHLHRKPALQTYLVVVDKLGFSHRIWIDDFEFLVQERGIEAREVLRELLAHHEEELVAIKLGQLVAFIQQRLAKGVADHDPAFLSNVGFSVDGAKVLQLDIGQLSTQNLPTFEEDLALRYKDMRYWASIHLPALLSYLDELILQ